MKVGIVGSRVVLELVHSISYSCIKSDTFTLSINKLQLHSKIDFLRPRP